jgi:hypothetical protein
MAKGKKTKTQQQRPTTQNVSVAKATKAAASAPQVNYKSDGTCRVSHSEYVMDLDGLSTTAVYSRRINPQANQLFTWLSAIATRFEMYRFVRLKFVYKPSSATTTAGYVAIGVDFDAYDAAPTKAILLTWKCGTKCAVWQNTTLDVSSDSRIATYRYCDTVGNRGDQRLEDLGKLYVLAYTTSATMVGELFVEYTVDFRQPSYKLLPVLYSTYPKPSVTSTAWFPATTVPTGNFVVSRVSDLQCLVEDVGEFLITMALAADSGIAASPTLSASQPVYAPTASYNFSSGDIAQSATYAMATYLLEVLVPQFC